jgi:hypothetical protein
MVATNMNEWIRSGDLNMIAEKLITIDILEPGTVIKDAKLFDDTYFMVLLG